MITDYVVMDIDCDARVGLQPTGNVVFRQTFARFEDASGRPSWSLEPIEHEFEEGDGGVDGEQYTPECLFEGQVGWRLVYVRTR